MLDRATRGTALDSIHRLNYVPDFGDWTNYMRTYAVHGERGHIVMSYPNGPARAPDALLARGVDRPGVRLRHRA